MSCPFVVFEAMGPPGSSPRTLGEHVGWVAGSRPLDSGAPHMVPPAAEQLGTRVARGWCLASFPDPGRRGAVQTGMGWVLDVQGRSARAVSVRGRLSPLAQDRRSVLPRRAAQALVVQTVRPTVLRGVVRQRRRARNTPCHAGDRSALATRGTCCAGPSVLVRTVRSALVVRGRLLKDHSTHLTGPLGSTQTELGPLVGGESECLGGVGQQVGHLVVHRGNGHLVTNLLA